MKLLSLVLASVTALALSACGQPSANTEYAKVQIQPFLGEPILGDANAPVKLVEYASTTCGHCLAFHEEVFPQLKEKYIDTGKVKLAWVVLPTQPEALSLAGGAIARCAGESRYFEAIDAMFDAQETLFNLASEPAKLQAAINAIGARFDLSPDAVATCVDDESIMEATRAALVDMPATITGTPSFAINGVQVEAESFEGLSAAIDAEIAKAAGTPVPVEPSEPAPTPPQ